METTDSRQIVIEEKDLITPDVEQIITKLFRGIIPILTAMTKKAVTGTKTVVKNMEFNGDLAIEVLEDDKPLKYIIRKEQLNRILLPIVSKYVK